jgi:hypothetical protein
MMTENKTEKAAVSLKEAIITGTVIDLLLLVLASMIMGCIMLFIVVAHWIFNAAILISPKARNSRAGKDFIRFAIFPLILVTFMVRGILILLGVDFLV